MDYGFNDSAKDDEAVITDQYCMEYLFLRSFFENTDLLDEFPMIAHEFSYYYNDWRLPRIFAIAPFWASGWVMLVKTLALLRLNFSKVEFTFEEVQALSVIYMFADKVTHEFGYIQATLNDIFDLSTEYVLEKPTRIRFQPDKITGRAGIKPEEEREQAEPVQEERSFASKSDNRELHILEEDALQREKRMLSEIEKLRTRLHNAEQENILLREKNKALHTLFDDVRILKQQHEDDRKELHALREHVYRSTESDVEFNTADL